ncbi:polysaccharide biosynthesis C-terminal domain-containing protein [Winogradskyella sp. 3972H.M.0a.05]|uniref:O-antigen translocase n=1 Tax=Winogradskyella sp. 3972H.M.0a.05 TaxID=2950277 RepID=UPI00339964AE
MKRLINYIRTNLLLKVASLNSVSVFVRLITGFATSKAIAIFVGPEGLALIGNFKNFLAPVQSISTLGLYNGIVKYVSEFKYQTFKLSKAISSSVYLVLFSTLIAAFCCWFGAEFFNGLVFSGQGDYTFVFKALAIALPFYSFQFLVLSINNGMSRFSTVLYISIIGQLLVTVLVLYLIWQYGLKGALLGLAIGEATLFIVVLFWVRKDSSFLRLVKFQKINLYNIRNLSAYSMMTLFSAIVLPLTMVMIRNYIINVEGTDVAGHWEAMNRISGYYLLFVSTLFLLYLLPKYSEIKTDYEFRNEVKLFYKTIIPIFSIGLLLIYFFRVFIIQLVFTEEFLPTADLFKWQLIGDLLKVISLVLSYQFIAKRMIVHFMLTEIVSVVLLYVFSINLIDKYGVEGANLAYCINYGIYLFILLIIFRKQLFGKLEMA